MYAQIKGEINMSDYTKSNDILRICLDSVGDTVEHIAEIMHALDCVQASRLPRCITVWNAGDALLSGEGCNAQWNELFCKLENLQIPLILGINGRCSGTGMKLLRYADLAVMSSRTRIEGYETPQAAVRADAVNRVVPEEMLEGTVEDYARRLAAIPEPLITFGHKLYFALEKLPDRLSRSKYGATVIGEIMAIQAALNVGQPEKTCREEEGAEVSRISYRNQYDRSHAILFEIRNDVEYIQLNSPQTRNMLDWRASMELAGAYALANTIPTLKAIVVTGIGKWFHLGGIRYCQADEYERERFADQLRLRNQVMREIRVPLISAVNGECSGGGMSLVLKSDRVIASEDAVFGYPEVKHHSFACNSMVNTMDLIPKKAALNMFYYGELFSAQRAKQYGIVQEIVSRDSLNEAVEKALANL